MREWWTYRPVTRFFFLILLTGILLFLAWIAILTSMYGIVSFGEKTRLERFWIYRKFQGGVIILVVLLILWAGFFGMLGILALIFPGFTNYFGIAWLWNYWGAKAFSKLLSLL